MGYLAIMSVDGNNRATKYAEFATQAAADAHVAAFIVKYPIAYTVLHPGGNISNLLCDPIAKTASISPLVKPKPTTISYEDFQNRFTAVEFDAATDFVYESDLVTGKPKRRATIQGLSRAMAKNAVDLLDARTTAFLDALVSGLIINAQRKAEILTP